MAIMKVTRTLRDGPAGNSLGVIAPMGSKIQVLDASTPPFIKIKLLDLPGQPEGFVTDDAVDTAANATLGPLDKGLFANECGNQEIFYGVSAHYLMAIAQLRTGVTAGPTPIGSGDIGPFALSPSEWKFFGTNPDFLLDFVDSDINFWRFQCAVFAVMTYLAQNKLADLLSMQPAATELYFSQLVGTKAGKTGLHTPDQQVADLIRSVAAADFQSDGIDPSRIIARWAGLLDGATVKEALDRIANKLQKALDDAKPFLVKIGAKLIPDPSATLPGPGNPQGINFDSHFIPTKPIPRKDMAKLIATRFSDAGFGTIQQIAAIANAIGESKLNPATVNRTPPEHSVGLFQLNMNGGAGAPFREEQLQDPEFNIKITIHTCQTDPTLVRFKTAADLRMAVTEFVRHFEKPRDPTGDIKIRFAIAQSLSLTS